MKIFPSLISADILNLEKTIQLLDPHCDGYHLDVMDFRFVANLTWGPMFINAFMEATLKPLHIHLMVENPDKWVPLLKMRPYDFFIFHRESILSATAVHTLLNMLKQKRCKVGIALSPDTPVEAITPFLPSLDSVLIMSVYPGFSGQKFLPANLKKAELLLKKREEGAGSFLIGMDGGINGETLPSVMRSGVDYVSVAHAIFSQKDVVSALKTLYAVGQPK